MFGRPKGGQPTRHLFVGNCGASIGIDVAAISQIFCQFGPAEVVVPEQQQNPRSAFVFVTYPNAAHAAAAVQALDGKPCQTAGGRVFTLKYADLKNDKAESAQQAVALSTDSCPVEGLRLTTNYVSEEEEQALLKSAEEGDWETLARRRVCHFGYNFEYQTRNVNPSKPGQAFPRALLSMLDRIQQQPDMLQVDQCTVNEYPSGVGLSPHIDTHSAFTGAIASLSLAGHAVMEFRQEGQEAFAVLLPRRSLLVMAGPARYSWQHYIPHRKADWVNGCLLPRASQRVSFTFRKVRGYTCDCSWPEHCDSQQGGLPPTRMAAKASSALPDQDTSQQQLAAQPHSSDSSLRISSARNAELHGRHDSQAHSRDEDPSGDNEDKHSSALQGARHSWRRQGPKTADDCSSTRQAHPAGLGAPSEAAAEPGDVGGQAGGANGTIAEAGKQRTGQADMQRLEQEYVHDVYNAIAPHFSSTRFAIWPKVRQFIEGLQPGAVVADVGCGNGKYFLVRPDVAVLGSDRSSGLVGVAATRFRAGVGAANGKSFRADVAVADGMRLPYAAQRFDAVLCIAVLHHITTAARRIEMLTELVRVLAPGGKALVTVWATEQEDMKKLAKWKPISSPGNQKQDLSTAPSGSQAAELSHGHSNAGTSDVPDAAAPSANLSSGPAANHAEAEATAEGRCLASTEPAVGAAGTQTKPASNDYFVPWHLPFHRAEAAVQVLKSGQPTGSGGGIHIDNKKGAVVFSRYYHVFEQFELDKLVEKVPCARVFDSFYDKDNWCVVMQRTQQREEPN